MLPAAQMHHGTRSTIFPRISKAPFSEQHRLFVCGSRFVRFASSLIIQAETKVFSAEFFVKSAFADSIIHFRITLANVLELAQAVFIMRVDSRIIEWMHALAHADIVYECDREIGRKAIEPVQIAIEIDVLVVSSHDLEGRFSDQ